MCDNIYFYVIFNKEFICAVASIYRYVNFRNLKFITLNFRHNALAATKIIISIVVVQRTGNLERALIMGCACDVVRRSKAITKYWR